MWGPESQGETPVIEDFWPTGTLSEDPTMPSRLRMRTTATSLDQDENGDYTIPTSGTIDHGSFDVVVGSISRTVETLQSGLYTRYTYYNTPPGGAREQLLQFVVSWPTKASTSTTVAPLPSGTGAGRPYPPPPGAVPRYPGFVPSPEQAPRIAPLRTPIAPGRSPAIRPSPLPAPSPDAQPERSPVPGFPGDPRTVPRPIPSPALPADPARIPLPRLIPIPLLPDFSPAPARTPEPKDLPIGTVIPWPGADPVGGTANAPPPTLTGLANVVGQIEGKLDQIGGREPGPALDDIVDKLRELLGETEPSYPAGAYELARVCEFGADGKPLPPLRAPWSSGSGALMRLEAKIDALAVHVGNHKVIKQPTCPSVRSSQPMGQPVTVTFEEVEEA